MDHQFIEKLFQRHMLILLGQAPIFFPLNQHTLGQLQCQLLLQKFLSLTVLRHFILKYYILIFPVSLNKLHHFLVVDEDGIDFRLQNVFLMRLIIEGFWSNPKNCFVLHNDFAKWIFLVYHVPDARQEML